MNVTRAWITILFAVCTAFAARADTIDVAVSSFRFTPNDITINVGDTVRWTNTGGFHNVRADDDAFGNSSSASAWVFTHTFTSAGDVRYYCEEHSSPGQNINTNMNGIVRVQATEPPPFAINQGIAGSWFNPATSGQGFLIDLLPEFNFMFVAWFTYEKPAAPAMAGGPKIGAPEHRWMTASGNYTGNVATLTLFSSRNGVFNDPATVTTSPVGTMSLNFENCSKGTITFDIPGEGVSGVIPISRQTTGMAAYCRSLIPPAATSPE